MKEVVCRIGRCNVNRFRLVPDWPLLCVSLDENVFGMLKAGRYRGATDLSYLVRLVVCMFHYI